MSLTPEQREWMALLIYDVFTIPEGQDFDAEASARLLEARIETLLRRERERIARAALAKCDCLDEQNYPTHGAPCWCNFAQWLRGER